MSDETEIRRAQGRYAAAMRWGTPIERQGALRQLALTRLLAQIEQALPHLWAADRERLVQAVTAPDPTYPLPARCGVPDRRPFTCLHDAGHVGAHLWPVEYGTERQGDGS